MNKFLQFRSKRLLTVPLDQLKTTLQEEESTETKQKKEDIGIKIDVQIEKEDTSSKPNDQLEKENTSEKEGDFAETNINEQLLKEYEQFSQ